jgi:hypothetical protein
LRTLLRIRLIAGGVAVFGVLLAVMLGLGAVFWHKQSLVTAALFALIASMLANAAAEGWRAYVLCRSGTWTSLDGKQVARAQQPSKFRTWVMLHLVFAAIWTSGAGVLVWSTHFLRL